jgi:hypothetical protein
MEAVMRHPAEERCPTMTDTISAQLAALPGKTTAKLRAMWQKLHGKPAPPFSQHYLVARLAYQIQELAYVGLRPATRAWLDALADGLDPKEVKYRAPVRLIAGTRLCRERQGVEHVVTVTRDGFEWQGRPYKSLSVVVRAITETRWNGPLFFGMQGKTS